MKVKQGNRIYWPLLILAAVLAGGILGSGIGPSARPALAATPYADIGDIPGTSPPELQHVYIGNDLSCQVAHTTDGAVLELYPPGTIPGDCGTFLTVDGALYTPDFANHGGTATGSLPAHSVFTPVSQTPSGLHTVVTVATAGGIQITETDSYIVGQELYRTDIMVANLSGSPKNVKVYRAGDCFLGASDFGFGLEDNSTHMVACTKNMNNTPPGRIEEWLPITPANHHYENFYASVWGAIGTTLPDTCTCGTSLDNGAAIEWDTPTLANGSSVTYSHDTVFSPTGQVPTPVPTPNPSAVGGLVAMPVAGSGSAFPWMMLTATASGSLALLAAGLWYARKRSLP